jgi:hypothetical protein
MTERRENFEVHNRGTGSQQKVLTLHQSRQNRPVERVSAFAQDAVFCVAPLRGPRSRPALRFDLRRYGVL